jgi:hypothetical protein
VEEALYQVNTLLLLLLLSSKGIKEKQARGGTTTMAINRIQLVVRALH